MKILRIIARLNVGGPAKHVVWLTDRMRKRGHESLLVAGTVPEGEEDMSYLAQQHGVEPIYLREMSRELSLKDAVSILKLYNIMRRERPHIVHTHTAKAGTVGRTAAFLYRWGTLGTLIGRPRYVRIVHTFHGHVLHGYYGPLKSEIFARIERVLGRFATDKIVVISQQQLDELNVRFSISRREKFELVPLGIDLGSFSAVGTDQPLRRELGISADPLLIAFIGRLTEIKDIPLLLHAMQAYTQLRHAPAIRLLVIGDGHLRPNLEGLARELGIDEFVTFLGNREDIAELLPQLDAVVLTSKNEGTPLSLIEAMAAGKPVVSTAVGGVGDLLGPVVQQHTEFAVCERGISITTRSPEDLACALIYAAKNENLRKTVGSAARDFVRENYSIERLEEDIAKLYADLLKDHRPSL
ncbi:MAG: glycosyltransferase [Pyrinomonadaceae bacterium]